jgi:adenylate cyclase
MHYAGDAVLAMFDAVVDAVSCATEVQDKLRERNQELPNGRKVQFRIGVNSGDVIEDRGDIYGDGVNVAARLESLAEPGGICVSDAVRSAVGKRLNLDYQNMGEQKVKNIEEPVRAYKVVMAAEEEPKAKEAVKPELELPDRPSVAVLPFSNMSADPEQDYFSDGLTEDIITELSRFPILFVIARHSSFAFKGKSIDIKEVGQQLGVAYVVEGSVRKAGNRVRITAQLIEVETGNHIWAERYDRELEDIFAVQDEVTRAIVAVIPGRVEKAVAERVQRKPTDNMKAYEFVLRGKIHWNRLNAEDVAEARRLFKKAVKLDSRYARAHAHLAFTYLADALFGWATADFSQETIESAQKAATLDSNDILCQSVLGYAYMERGLWEDTEKQFDKVIAQNVNDAEIMAWSGDALGMLGRHEEGRKLIVEAMRLDPLHPPLYDWFLGGALYSAKRYEDVVQVLTGVALLNSLAYTWLAGAYAYLGRVEEARRALDAFIRERRRELSTANILVEADTIGALAEAYRNHYRLEADWENVFDGLRKAGLPD